MKRSYLKPYLRSAALILAMTAALSGCRVSDEFSGASSNSANASDTPPISISVSDNSSAAENNSGITDVGSVGGDDPVYSAGSFTSTESSLQSTSEIDLPPSVGSSSIPSLSSTADPENSGSAVISSRPSSANSPQSSSGSVISSSPASVSSPQRSSSPVSSKVPVISSIPISSSSAAQSSAVSASGFSFSWKSGNTWEENGKKCGTAELTITNNSGKNVSGWTASFAVPSGFSITNGWSGDFSVNGTTATIKNAAFNGSIPNGSSVTAGFNYSSPGAFTMPSKITFNGTLSAASTASSGNQGGNNNSQSSQTQQNPNTPVSTDIKEMLTRTPNAKQGDDWLHVSGNKILDKDGREVWLTGVNWFGYNTGTNIFDGLWNSNLRSSVKAIADHGFNLIRVPISAELLNQWSRGEYPRANYNNALNPELNALNSLQIFEYFLKLAEENGMKVMPDIHCAETDAQGHNVNLWYTDKVTVDDYYHALEWLADRYKNNDTIIAIDLKNEPHGKPNESNKAIWNDSTDINNWKHTAEVAAQKVLAKNPNVLIMVEGTEIYSKKNGSYTSTNSADYDFNWWGGNLRGVKDYPVNLGKYQDKLVYSPHDYGPTVFEQPWFKSGYNYDSLIRDCWQDNWLYIHKTNTAPLLIGEWGGYMREPNLTWMTCMRRLIKENRLNHTFWCFNANSGDTGGLVLDDFVTWDTEKYNFVKEVLWQQNGKFVGLDHQIPLGENGVSIGKLS